MEPTSLCSTGNFSNMRGGLVCWPNESTKRIILRGNIIKTLYTGIDRYQYLVKARANSSSSDLSLWIIMTLCGELSLNSRLATDC